RAMTATPTFTPGGTPSTTHGPIATMALKAAPHVSWYRTARGGMYALGVFIAMVVAFMGMRAFGIGPIGSLRAAGRLNQRDQIWRAMTATPTFTPGGTPSTTHGPIATMALKAAPHVSWYRTARGGMYALGVFIAMVVAFMGMRAFGIGPIGSLRAAGRLNPRD